MKNKIIYIFFILLIAIFLPTVFVSAENVDKTEKDNKAAVSSENTSTIATLKALIEQLQQQIKDLQNQLAELKAEVKEVKEQIIFTKNLYKGLSDEEVKELQKFLSQYREIYPEGLVTGYFGPLTEKAVKKFQEKNDIPPTGLVGPITREKINDVATERKVTICHYPPENPTNKHTIEIAESALGAHLAHGDTVGACGTEPQPAVPSPTPTPIPDVSKQPLQIFTAQGAYRNFVPGEVDVKIAKFELVSGGDSDIVINKLVIAQKGGSGCPFRNYKLYNHTSYPSTLAGAVVSPDSECKAVFDNLNLTIAGDKKSVSLMLNLDILSSARVGDVISFGITELECAPNTCPSGISGLPAYAPQITIVSAAIPTISVISPAKGEKLAIGQPYTFKWATKNIPSDARIEIRFIPMVPEGSSLIISFDALANLTNDGSETWIVSPSIASGNYIIDVAAYYFLSGTSRRIVVGSDIFSVGITATETTTGSPTETIITSSVKVLSPNDYAQEKWYIGNSYPIKWETTDYSKSGTIKIFLFNNKTGAEELIAETTNTGIYTWTVPAILGKMKLGEGLNYKIRIELNVSGSSRRIYDDCDLFSIL